MFSYFRWIVQATQISCNQTNISNNLSKYGGFSDVQLNEIVSDNNNKFIADNFAALEEHLRQFKPSFVGNFSLNEFKHINALKLRSMSRSQQYRATSIITGMCSVNLRDNFIKINDGHGDGFLSIEDSFSPSSFDSLQPSAAD